MNYLAHALPFLEEPYFAAGTGVPDWLSVADRRVRVRSKHAEQFLRDGDRHTAMVAGGILQHVRDDDRFHGTRAFVELGLQLTTGARDLLDREPGFRPGFLGHLLVEVLLDASLGAEDPKRIEAYYQTLDKVDAAVVQRTVNRMSPRPTDRLATMIASFRRELILWDYLEDAKLMVRLNQVMRRVKLPELPAAFVDFLPEARRLVDARRDELLEGIPVAGSQSKNREGEAPAEP